MSGQLSDEGAGTDFFRRKLVISMIIPGVFVFLMWFVKAVELMFDVDLTRMGIYPLSVNGLQGILFSPLIHSGFGHLFNNSLPLFFLGTFLFYFYSEIAVKVSLWVYFLTGAAVWVTGREAWHIGASGLIYGMASFLFFSGIIRKHFRLAGLSLLIVFLYGSMVWGLFPDVYRDVSWESHLLGFVAGIVLAVLYRKQGPQAPVYEWPEDEVSIGDEAEEKGISGSDQER
ncbi:MAG TPA: rhomboid family intramembrane serine protease [Bacteroidales bacterium]|jgi:membrane associated rhomboid family serine protease|nr:rhomboid family intramembrane serine protease [Bacteroidales bacterium]